MTNARFRNSTDAGDSLVGLLVHASTSLGRLTEVRAATAREAGAFVLTGRQLLDFDPYIGPVVRDQPLLAIDRVRYTGEPVAVVAADTIEEARAAAGLISIEVAPLSPSVTGAAPGEPALVHLTELLRPGPLAEAITRTSARSNQLLARRFEFAGASRTRDEKSFKREIELSSRCEVETLESSVVIEGGVARIESASRDADQTRAQLAMLYNPVGLEVSVAPGVSGSPIATAVDALAIALARTARRPVRLVSQTRSFGWSGPRARLSVNGAAARLTIDAGAVVGDLPYQLDALAAMLESHLHIHSLSIEIDYSGSPPIAATLEHWREALAPE